jgi:hypothetical protein
VCESSKFSTTEAQFVARWCESKIEKRFPTIRAHNEQLSSLIYDKNLSKQIDVSYFTLLTRNGLKRDSVVEIQSDLCFFLVCGSAKFDEFENISAQRATVRRRPTMTKKKNCFTNLDDKCHMFSHTHPRERAGWEISVRTCVGALKAIKKPSSWNKQGKSIAPGAPPEGSLLLVSVEIINCFKRV